MSIFDIFHGLKYSVLLDWQAQWKVVFKLGKQKDVTPTPSMADSGLFPPILAGTVAASIQTKNKNRFHPADSGLPPPTSWQAQWQVVFRQRNKGNVDKGKLRVAKPYHFRSITGGDIPTKGC
jgi:hypothetical protein